MRALRLSATARPTCRVEEGAAAYPGEARCASGRPLNPLDCKVRAGDLRLIPIFRGRRAAQRDFARRSSPSAAARPNAMSESACWAAAALRATARWPFILAATTACFHRRDRRPPRGRVANRRRHGAAGMDRRGGRRRRSAGAGQRRRRGRRPLCGPDCEAPGDARRWRLQCRQCGLRARARCPRGDRLCPRGLHEARPALRCRVRRRGDVVVRGGETRIERVRLLSQHRPDSGGDRDDRRERRDCSAHIAARVPSCCATAPAVAPRRPTRKSGRCAPISGGPSRSARSPPRDVETGRRGRSSCGCASLQPSRQRPAALSTASASAVTQGRSLAVPPQSTSPHSARSRERSGAPGGNRRPQVACRRATPGITAAVADEASCEHFEAAGCRSASTTGNTARRTRPE